MNVYKRYHLANICLRVPWGRLGGLPHKYSQGEYNTHIIIIMKLFAALTFAVNSVPTVFSADAEAQYHNNKCKNLLRVSD